MISSQQNSYSIIGNLSREVDSIRMRSKSICESIQDCKDDYQTLDRVYLPLNWVSEAGLDLVDLNGKKTTPALRRVLNWMLLGIGGHLNFSKSLPNNLQSVPLSIETSIIYQIALKLFNKSPIHEKCAYCPYKTLKFGERSDSLKSFSGDHFQTANKIDAPMS